MLRALFYIFIPIVALGALAVFALDAHRAWYKWDTRDGRSLAAEINTRKQGQLGDILPGKWDVVCWLGPYGSFSDLRQDAMFPAGVPLSPDLSDVGEGEYALALIDSGLETMRIVIVPRWGVGIGEFRGPRCMKREDAAFSLEKAEGQISVVTLGPP